jgi:hypothetical protein
LAGESTAPIRISLARLFPMHSRIARPILRRFSPCGLSRLLN